ncbi:hypothetical protein [Blautia marasmi]|uniref:hypothetical protein n=1 Tax=Blautia marasmi TaxID=1917868 RepID=UPI000CF2078E|nr:hypothetical protein [Blautia marasmi]
MFKKLVAFGTAATMIMAMGVTTFAAEGDSTTLVTKLYKNDKFDSSAPDSNLSMGNAAVENTTYVELGNGTYEVTINLKESFKAYGMTGYLTNVQIDADRDGEYNEDEYDLIYNESKKAVVGVVFTSATVPTEATKYDASFKTNVSIMPASEGDFIIFPTVVTE